MYICMIQILFKSTIQVSLFDMNKHIKNLVHRETYIYKQHHHARFAFSAASKSKFWILFWFVGPKAASSSHRVVFHINQIGCALSNSNK